MYNKVELCGMNTAKLPVLTEAEKRELLVRFAVENNPVLEGWGNKIVMIKDGE